MCFSISTYNSSSAATDDQFQLSFYVVGTRILNAGGTTPEPPVVEPDPVKGWGLVGEFNGWGAEPDAMLASDGTYLVAKGVALSGQFKFRKDADWAVNFGAAGDVEPFELTANAVGGSVNGVAITEENFEQYLLGGNQLKEGKSILIRDNSYFSYIP